MNKKVVLIVDEDKARAEKLVFMVRLGGYEPQLFGSTAAALNWIKYGDSVNNILCLLFNHPAELRQTEEIFTAWAAAGMIVPVVLVQRGEDNWSHNARNKDHFFVCMPEEVMQTLDILSVIEYADNDAPEVADKFLAYGEAPQ